MMEAHLRLKWEAATGGGGTLASMGVGRRPHSPPHAMAHTDGYYTRENLGSSHVCRLNLNPATTSFCMSPFPPAHHSTPTTVRAAPTLSHHISGWCADHCGPAITTDAAAAATIVTATTTSLTHIVCRGRRCLATTDSVTK
ncbi:hypothetical protein E2C01_067409 [Portunus trituberculatus]|uniref:Uncharacterized protein n=1 Tax=Portunus trituberculatus TaxID=210409 RepID=A0A5B7HJQ5_PORTR|nr:hypothetical protein [Portunus trituberculatus]